MAFNTWRHNYLPIFNLKIKIINLIEINKQQPKLLKKIVLQKIMDLRMCKEKIMQKKIKF